MIVWPESLIEELASRKCIIILGAGASAGCLGRNGERPPTWFKFLNDAKEKFVPASDHGYIDDLFNKGMLLDAAEVILSFVEAPELNSFYRKSLHTPDFQPSRLHEIVKELDGRIVVTTNYDTIYEKICEPHNVTGGYITKKYNSTAILEEVRSSTRLIIKAHGCVTEPKDIVLTRSQYFESKKNTPSFYNLLDSLFLTNTVFFIGCGLNDPDIQLVLENSNISVPCTYPHYAIVPSERHPIIVNSIKKSYNIKLLEYENSDGTHSNLIPAMEDLLQQVGSFRSTYQDI